nr:MAG TPA: hypothetical protein [Caudoviricetes sp.]
MLVLLYVRFGKVRSSFESGGVVGWRRRGL